MFRKSKGKFFASALFASILFAGCNGDEIEVIDESTAPDSEDAENTAESAVIVVGDTINSHHQKDAVCVVDSRFERGHTLVFRASVTDNETNETLEDAKVKAVLATGDEYEMKLGPHGEEATPLWTVAWEVPEDFPTGTLDYKIVAEVDGKEYTYEPFNVSLSKLTILEKGAESQTAAGAEEAASEDEATTEGEGEA